MSHDPKKLVKRMVAAVLSVSLSLSSVPFTAIAESVTETESSIVGADGAESAGDVTSEESTEAAAVGEESTEETASASLKEEVTALYSIRLGDGEKPLKVGDTVQLSVKAVGEPEKRDPNAAESETSDKDQEETRTKENEYRIAAIKIGSEAIDVKLCESYDETITITEGMVNENGEAAVSVSFMQVFTAGTEEISGDEKQVRTYSVYADDTNETCVGTLSYDLGQGNFTVSVQEGYRVYSVIVDGEETVWGEEAPEDIPVSSGQQVQVMFTADPCVLIACEQTFGGEAVAQTAEAADAQQPAAPEDPAAAGDESAGAAAEHSSGITITPVTKPNAQGIYNQDVTVQIHVKDTADDAAASGAGIRQIDYWIESDGTRTTGVTTPYQKKTGELEHTLEKKIEINAAHNHGKEVVLHVMVMDGSGNSREAVQTFCIITEQPVISVSYDNNQCRNKKYFNAPRTATVVIKNEAEYFDEAAATNGISVTAEETQKDEGEPYVISGWDSDGDTHTATISFLKNARYELHLSYTDLAGNTAILEEVSEDTAAPYQFTIDSEPPTGSVAIEEKTWDKVVSMLTFGWYKERKHVDAKGLDSSPFTLEYYINKSEKLMDGTALSLLTAWQPYPDKGFFLPDAAAEDGHYVAYLKITDYAGNVSFVSSNGYAIDTRPCTVKMETVPSEGAQGQTMQVAVDIVDTVKGLPYSGVEEASYWVTNGDRITQKGTFTVTDQEVHETISIDTASNEGTNAVLHVQATDQAGNPCTNEMALDIDITPPEIFISYDNNQSINDLYFNKARTATITIVEQGHFDPKAATDSIKVTALNKRDGKVNQAYRISDWATSGDTHTAIVQFLKDAKYTLDISYTDSAGNPGVGADTGDSAAPYRFIIDMTAPGCTLKAASADHAEKEWKIAISDITFDLFRKSKVTVTAVPSDTLSEITEVVYFKDSFTDRFDVIETQARSAEELEKIYRGEVEGEAFREYPGGVSMDVEEKAVVYVRITDSAGNVTYRNTNGLITDSCKPSLISLTTSEDEDKAIQNEAVRFHVEVSDVQQGKAYSGIQEIYYFVSKDGKKIGKDQRLYHHGLDDSNVLRGSWAGDFVLDPRVVEAYNQDKLDVSVVVIDNAGNVYGEDSALAEVSMNVDELEIEVSFEDETGENRLNDSYFQSRRATVTIRNDRSSSFDGEAASLAVREAITAADVTDALGNKAGDVTDLVTISEWTTDMEQDTVHYAVVEFPYCGNYTWKPTEYRNGAGNRKNIVDTEFSFTIDTIAPAGEITIGQSLWNKLAEVLTFGIYTSDTFEVSMTASDEISPTRIDYYISQNTERVLSIQELDQVQEWQFYSDAEHAGQRFRLSDPGNYVVYVRITDYAGNVTYVSSDGHIIDGQEATIRVTLDEPNQNGIYHQDVNAHIEVEDLFPYSGLQKVEYWITRDDMETKREPLLTDTGEAPSYGDLINRCERDIIISAEDNNSCNTVLHVLAVDRAGHEAKYEQKIDIDVTPPEIAVSYDNDQDYQGNGYFDAVRTATVVITERDHHFDGDAAAKGITITAVDAQGTPVESAYHISDWHTEYGGVPDQDTHTATIQYTADANYQFEICYTDKADNRNQEITTGTSAAPFRFTVDTTAPVGTIRADSAEGRTETWNELARTLTWGFWSNTNIHISGTSSDVTSPVASVQYYKLVSDKSAGTPAILTIDELNAVTAWKDFSTLDVGPNEQFIVYLKIADMAGNTAYISTNGLIVDDDAPREEIAAPRIDITPEQTASGIYNSDVTLNVTVEDQLTGGTYSGLRTISYRVFNMGNETQSGELYSFGNTLPLQENLLQKWTGQIVVDAAMNNSNDVVVEVYAEDNARNGSFETASLRIDITSPSIQVSYSNNAASDHLFRSGRTARISIRERNFSREHVNLAVTRNGAPYGQALVWSQSGGTGNGDDTIWYAELPFTADGDYTFAISCTDAAANQSGEVQFASGTIYPDRFTIDGSAPKISVTFLDADDAPQGDYYKEARTAVISIEEEHFDKQAAAKGVVITAEDEVKALPAIQDWKESGSTHTATVVFSEDALYHLRVAYTDRAGNAGTPYETQFYVDTKDPQLEVTVNDKKGFGAYKDEVIPVISYSDENFDAEKVTIAMTGVNVSVSEPEMDGEHLVFTLEGESGKKIKWKASIQTNEEENGQTLTFENFPDQKNYKEFDDIYTITVSLTDKSGRRSEAVQTFSVNRYGSTYDVSAIQDLLGAYRQEEESIVIEEINPDALTEHTVTLFKNNETLGLREGTDYEVEAAGTDGKWHRYVYTIYPENFAEDGIYSITLYSRDKAGNVSENTLDTEESDISFAIDKTPPTVSLTNLESGKTYIEQSREILMTADDNLKLSEIQVYLDGCADAYCSWNAEDIASMLADEDNEFKNQYTFTIPGDSTRAHMLRVVCTDASGRTTELTVDDFYITSNPIIPWLRRYGWIMAVVLAAACGGIVFLVIKKRREKTRS